MAQLDRSAEQSNVTLEAETARNPFEGMRFPCCLCSAALDVRISIRNKPYCICHECGVQIFFRGKSGIAKLNELIGTLKYANPQRTLPIRAVILFSDIENLRRQKGELEAKQGLISADPDLTIAIHAVDNQIKRVQRELRKISRKRRLESR
jgi:DNA-directed RNA polymerase subunit RPC12/RpoP